MKRLGIVLSAALDEARSWPGRPAMLWLLLGAPIMVFALIWLLFGSGDMRNLPVALCDLDRSTLSHRLERWLDACPGVAITHMVNSPENGATLLRQGKVYAFVLIPRDFERDVLRKRPVRFMAWLDGQNMAAAGLLKRDISDVGAAFWRQQDSEMRGNAGTPRETALIQSSTVSLDLRPVGNPTTNYRIFLLPGILPAIIQLAAGIASACALEHLLRPGPHAARRRGTPCAPAILGSQLALTLWYALLGLGLSALLRLHGDLLLPGGLASLIPAWLLMAGASAALGHLLYAIRPSLGEGLSLISVYSSPALAFAGLTFPLASMPFLGRYWAMSLPITHYIDYQTHAGQLGASLAGQWPALLAMFLLCLAFTGLALKLTVRRAARLAALAAEHGEVTA